ncbi:hypothetical protein B4O83_09440 [Chromohalobacter israelensis]|nr:hypothetical protein B4O83_09440 [Chromohalobacter salexigens]
MMKRKYIVLFKPLINLKKVHTKLYHYRYTLGIDGIRNFHWYFLPHPLIKRFEFHDALISNLIPFTLSQAIPERQKTQPVIK